MPSPLWGAELAAPTVSARWGLTVGVNPPPDGDAELAALGERLGYTDIWNGEVDGGDGAVSMAVAAMATSRARLGTGILNVYSRTPFLLAMAASSLQHLSGGRFCLGLGTSSQRIVEEWHGVDFDRPLARVRDVVDFLRRLLAGEAVEAAGTIRIRRARLSVVPPARVPIYLAALGPAMLRLGGEVADGVVLNFIAPSDLEWMRAAVRDGTSRSADPADRETVVRLLVPYPGDDDAAVDAVRGIIAGYATAPVYRSLLERIGFSKQVRASLDARASGDRVAARAAIDDAAVAALAVVGTPDQQRARIEEYVRAGADVPVLTFFHATDDADERRSLTVEAATRFAPTGRTH